MDGCRLAAITEESAKQDHPQIKAFAEAALILRADRYWQSCSTGEQVEFLRALGDVLTEVCYQLDVNDVVPADLTELPQDLAASRTRIYRCRLRWDSS